MESPVSQAAVIRRGGVALLLCATLPRAVPAQTPALLTGRVVYRGAASVSRPLPRHWTYLHEFLGDSSRALDSVRTDGAGRYRLTVARPDTAARYVVATQYAEVDYFSQPLILPPRARHEVDPIFVYDTTSRGAMRLERRLIAVFRAEPAPGRRAQVVVQEMLEVANPGERTRVATDTTNPVWTMRLPQGLSEWSFAAGDITPEAAWLHADTVKLFAPIWPGAPLRASYRYTLATREIRVPVDQWTGEVTVLVDDTTAVVAGAPLQPLGTRELEGQRFVAYGAGPLESGTEIRVTLARGPLAPEDLLPYVIAGAGVALVAGLWFALRRRPAAAPPETTRRRSRASTGAKPQ